MHQVRTRIAAQAADAAVVAHRQRVACVHRDRTAARGRLRHRRPGRPVGYDVVPRVPLNRPGQSVGVHRRQSPRLPHDVARGRPARGLVDRTADVHRHAAGNDDDVPAQPEPRRGRRARRITRRNQCRRRPATRRTRREIASRRDQDRRRGPVDRRRVRVHGTTRLNLHVPAHVDPDRARGPGPAARLVAGDRPAIGDRQITADVVDTVRHAVGGVQSRKQCGTRDRHARGGASDPGRQRGNDNQQKRKQ